MRLVVATRNRDKLVEIRRALEGLSIELVSIADFPGVPEVEEDGATLEDNAIKKATSAARATGLAVIADDTGLEVEALGGAPGVFSARYAGEGASYEDNCRRLLREMEVVPLEKRGARFRCVIALAGLPLSPSTGSGQALPSFTRGEGSFSKSPSLEGRGQGEGDDVILIEGVCEGRITTDPRGSQGFGYDPVFEIPELGKTFAELSLTEKNQISHRGRALNALRQRLSGPR